MDKISAITRNTAPRSKLLDIPADLIEDILEHITGRDDCLALSNTCSALREILAPKLFPRRVKLFIWPACHDWRNGRRHFNYPGKICEQGYLDDEGSERILNAPAGCLRYVKEFRVMDVAHMHDRLCPKTKHRGLRRPDELVLTMILRKLTAEAEDLQKIVIPRTITVRMIALILESVPNIQILETGIETRAFQRGRLDRNAYYSLTTTASPLFLQRLKLSITDKGFIQGALRSIERCSHTLRELEIKITFYNDATKPLDGLENYPNAGPNDQWTKLKFPCLEKLQIKIIADDESEFANWLLHLADDFGKLSSVTLEGGKDTQELVHYLIDHGADIKALQLVGKSKEIGREGEPEMKTSRLIERLDHPHTLQLVFFDDWNMTTVHAHRHSIRRLWLNCHTTHSPSKTQSCPVEKKIFQYLDMHPFTTKHWPLLEELTVPYSGIDKLPLHEGIRVLRIEHLYDKALKQDKYEQLLRDYINKLLVYSAPSKPKLETIVIMPDMEDEVNLELYPSYLCIGYIEETVTIDTRDFMSSLLVCREWSYLYQEQVLGRMWDNQGIWAEKGTDFYED
ncbi:hypothetical protein TWF730_001659 [Orbilia blumenaviensis]|uniref:F-box domain-containing protein n=1 Tax=Orbilia blumenaviensis TaxID=1796055 RepID=A0AAV9UMS0_9PEZI